MEGFRVARDAMDRQTEIIALSDSRSVLMLAAGQAKTLTVPSGATVALINATAPVWVRFGGSAAVPSADITDGSAPELNPGPRLVKEGMTIGVAAAQSSLVNILFYQGAKP
ncbi:MAG: hypothetical protein HQL37_01295 [Alphaproteobacteria bacterium]|nr:hypothetical protein [Alphaproteobacteria bacterium]